MQIFNKISLTVLNLSYFHYLTYLYVCSKFVL